MKTVDRSALDSAAAALRRAQEANRTAASIRGYKPELAAQLQDAANRDLGVAIEFLAALGAHIPPVGGGPAPAPEVIPLQLLASPANRELLRKVEEAADAGAIVDRERGHVDQDGHPAGWGAMLSGYAAGIRVEVEGPQRSGGRE